MHFLKEFLKNLNKLIGEDEAKLKFIKSIENILK